MEILRTITDTDLGLDTPAPAQYKERMAARAVAFDADGKVALFHSTKKHYHKLPGGGIEVGESQEEALKRECLEEIGCNVTNLREVGAVEEYRNKFEVHQMSYCYLADVEGDKGEPHMEEGEIAEGFVVVWMTIDEAIQTLAGEEGVEDYQGKFIQQRDLLLLKEAKKLL